MEDLPVSVIIPALNEARTIAGIVETCLTWGKAKEIIVVNDEGTTDGTSQVLSQFKNRIALISNKKDRGKGEAMACGLLEATGELMLVLDGDMTNLTHRDLDHLVRPVMQDKADMVIGCPRFWRMGSFEPWNDVSGTRVFWRRHVDGNISAIKKAGYGVEILFNELHKDLRIKRIHLPYVFVFNKLEKQTVPEAVQAYVREAKELIFESLRQQTGDIPPQARKALRVVRRYLKLTLDYFQ